MNQPLLNKVRPKVAIAIIAIQQSILTVSWLEDDKIR